MNESQRSIEKSMNGSTGKGAPANAVDRNSSYEWKVVTLMALGMGLTGAIDS